MQKSFEIKISEDNSYFERRAAGPLFMKLVAFLETISMLNIAMAMAIMMGQLWGGHKVQVIHSDDVCI